MNHERLDRNYILEPLIRIMFFHSLTLRPKGKKRSCVGRRQGMEGAWFPSSSWISSTANKQQEIQAIVPSWMKDACKKRNNPGRLSTSCLVTNGLILSLFPGFFILYLLLMKNPKDKILCFLEIASWSDCIFYLGILYLMNEIWQPMNGKSPEVKTNHACLHGSFMITRGAFTFLSMGASFSPDSLMEQVLSYRLSGSIFSLFLPRDSQKEGKDL